MSPRIEGQPQSYDAARQELERLLGDLQAEDVSVDRLSANVRRAVDLIKFCRAFLNKTEEEVKKALSEVSDPAAEAPDDAPPPPHEAQEQDVPF